MVGVTMAGVTMAGDGWAGFGGGALVMGILNATPNSFSDGGDRLDPQIAIEAGMQMAADGADIVDVGGESTRPGSLPVPADVEQERVLPVIAALARAGVAVSVDTRNADTMARALEAGARIVNDVSALMHDPDAVRVVAQWRCLVVLMHMRGTPATMKSLAVYQDVVGEVAQELHDRVEAAVAAGVRRQDVAVDPGFGFAKTAAQNAVLMRGLPVLAELGRPLVIGISRKSTIGMLTGVTDPKRRGPGSVAAALFAISHGARIVRVHDVAETVQAVRVWRGLAGELGSQPVGGAA